MRASPIVVCDIFAHNPVQMPFIQYQDLVQAFFPDGPDPALCVGVGIRRSVRRVDDLCPLRRKGRVERLGELPIIVMQQKPDGFWSFF